MSDITRLLGAASGGDALAVQQLYALLYPDIRRIARSRLIEAGGVTGLDTTALVADYREPLRRRRHIDHCAWLPMLAAALLSAGRADALPSAGPGAGFSPRRAASLSALRPARRRPQGPLQPSRAVRLQQGPSSAEPRQPAAAGVGGRGMPSPGAQPEALPLRVLRPSHRPHFPEARRIRRPLS